MSLADMKGFSVPFSPNGRANTVGPLPWNFGVDLFAVHFKANPDEIRKLLPEPLELSEEEPDGAYVWFGDWQGIWTGGENMLATNAYQVQYQECLFGVRCSYKGKEGQRVVYIWVDKDFSMLRGWFMGFPKKIGRVNLGSTNRHLHNLNPALKGVAPGMRYAAWCESKGERTIDAAFTLKEIITPDQLPKPFGTDLFHTIHFPSSNVDNPQPHVHQLVETISSNHKFGEIWRGEDAECNFYDSKIEEHFPLRPREITGSYLIPVGFTIGGTKVLHDYNKK